MVTTRTCHNTTCNKPFTPKHRGGKRQYCSRRCFSLVYERTNYPRRYATHRATLQRYPWIRHWSNLKTRCRNPNRATWKYYGGRGIEVRITLEEIKSLYQRDNAHLMQRPSIDRINPNGHYEYANCQFIELSENTRKGLLAPRKRAVFSPAERERRSAWMKRYGLLIRKGQSVKTAIRLGL